ncbi:MAG: UDP-N-acetylglucosamine 2-epimerase (non-hydrolyzing) [Flavobacteriales bacterium]|nr:UDP-N-acetylglucosamine 2-epimerase (non-hydrolyzing) [Flavobacteriales bacterium]
MPGIASMMLALEPVLIKERPDVMMVVGDVDSTLAAALTANKVGIALAHLESGLRSRDRGMPEEFNRIVTDRLGDHLFVTEPSGRENLIAEGTSADSIHLVGNTMIDSLVAYDDLVQANDILERSQLVTGGYALMTMHRPATVDDPKELDKMISLIEVAAKDRTVVFSVHPRTRTNMERFGSFKELENIKNLQLHGPLDYFAFQKLIAHSEVVITDSGGIQEETTFRQIPCLTLRPNTERPITVTEGSNELVPFDRDALADALNRIRDKRFKESKIPHLWDGHATERVFDVLDRSL